MSFESYKHGAPVSVIWAIALAVLPLSTAHAATVLVDWGAGTGTFPTGVDDLGRQWNNVTSTLTNPAGTSWATTTNTPSGITYQLSRPQGTVQNPAATTGGFFDNNTLGTASPTGDVLARGYPVSATSDALYASALTPSGGVTIPSVNITLAGLDPAVSYTLDFFASRASTTENRETQYHVAGATISDVFINPSSNTGTIAGTTLQPTVGGTIVITVDPGPNNASAAGFYYLNILEINYTAVPEPSLLGMIGAGGLLSLRRRRDRA